MTLHVIGVRHHSPACARLVKERIERIKPRHVLVEGPADLNPRMGEFFLGHTFPIAVFTYYQTGGYTHSSWTPFCRHSPEWIALETGRAAGARIGFMDLPAWTRPFRKVRNRYRDHPSRSKNAVDALCETFRVDNADTLWDHLFERPLEIEELSRRLDAYFEGIRQDLPPSEEDGPREDFMVACISWALTEAAESRGDVIAVCGGYHAPALARRAATGPPVASPPCLPAPEEGARFGSYFVPYSWKRLDSFAGYESGLPSPAFYDAVWEAGPENAPERLLKEAVRRLRKKKQPVSAADLIACVSLAQALARMRGHPCLLRTDLLDGIAAALVKDGMEVPLPWNYRGVLLPRTDPVLVEVVAALCGEKPGRLAPGTPQPPLVLDVATGLESMGLRPGETDRTERLDLTREDGLLHSRFLHRLRVLSIPGFSRVRGPEDPAGRDLLEEWKIAPHPAFESALIEAGSRGATLELAVTAFLEEAVLLAQGRISALAKVLTEAVFCGITSLATIVLEETARGLQQEPSFREVGRAAPVLFSLWRYGSIFGGEGALVLEKVLEALFERGLWLLEQIQGASAPADPDEVAGVRVLRDLARFGSERLSLPVARADSVMQRIALDPEAPPALRGAATGFRWSLGSFENKGAGAREAERIFKSISRVASYGDFLSGLFALAREEAIHAPALLSAIDTAINALDPASFLAALPALRLSFTFFPPRERAGIAETVLRIHQGGDVPLNPRALLQLEVPASVYAAGLQLDEEVSTIAKKYGLAGNSL